jgi:hypothetical protein
MTAWRYETAGWPDAYFRMCARRGQHEIAAIREALYRYCRMDTLGMVELVRKLRKRI